MDNVKEKKTLDNYVRNFANNEVYTFVLAVLDSIEDGDSPIFNPLCICGSTGFGKTHLLKAIEAHIRQRCQDKSVEYLDGQQFVKEVMKCYGGHISEENCMEECARLKEFRQKYRTADVFLIDDIQYILAEPELESEILSIFNVLLMNGKTIIITSDKNPHRMKNLSERIKERLSMGVVTFEQTEKSFAEREKFPIIDERDEFDEEDDEFDNEDDQFKRQNDVGNNWEKIKETIRKEYDISFVAYNTWIKPLKFHSEKDGVITILVPEEKSNKFNYIVSKYKDFFKVAISEEMDYIYDVQFELES